MEYHNVYRQYKLSRGEDGKFQMEHKSIKKPHCVVSSDYAEECNANVMDSGLWFEIDQEETAKLHADIKRRHDERIARIERERRVSYPNMPIVEKKIPVVVEEKKVEAKEVHVKEDSADQVKYDRRKKKLLDAGYTFDEEKLIFSNGVHVITSEEVVDMANVKFGKLIKK